MNPDEIEALAKDLEAAAAAFESRPAAIRAHRERVLEAGRTVGLSYLARRLDWARSTFNKAFATTALGLKSAAPDAAQAAAPSPASPEARPAAPSPATKTDKITFAPPERAPHDDNLDRASLVKSILQKDADK